MELHLTRGKSGATSHGSSRRLKARSLSPIVTRMALASAMRALHGRVGPDELEQVGNLRAWNRKVARLHLHAERVPHRRRELLWIGRAPSARLAQKRSSPPSTTSRTAWSEVDSVADGDGEALPGDPLDGLLEQLVNMKIAVSVRRAESRGRSRRHARSCRPGSPEPSFMASVRCSRRRSPGDGAAQDGDTADGAGPVTVGIDDPQSVQGHSRDLCTVRRPHGSCRQRTEAAVRPAMKFREARAVRKDRPELPDERIASGPAGRAAGTGHWQRRSWNHRWTNPATCRSPTNGGPSRRRSSRRSRDPLRRRPPNRRATTRTDRRRSGLRRYP